MLRQLLPAGRVGKDPFHAGLGVVKIPLDRAHMDVAALLSIHLALLHGADPVLGIEHHDLGSSHIPEALQGSLAGITGGSHQDHGLFAAADLAHRLRQQVGQNLKRHILKGAGGAVPQLQHIHIFISVLLQRKRRRMFSPEFIGAVSLPHAFLDFRLCKIRQKIGKNPLRPALIGHLLELA